jgi:hypothetical protein
MKRRALAPSDSLELLLDTMCNTFGGIVLIALLVALLSGNGGPSPNAAPSRALFDQRIALAEADLDALRKQAASPSEDDTATTAGELAAASAGLLAARADAAATSADTISRTEAIAANGGAAWRQIAEELRALTRREAELQNLIAATRSETARLRDREAALKAQAQRERDEQTVKLRFPKERTRTRNSLAVICQHGRLYPILTAAGAQDRANISWRTVGADSEETTTLADRGIRLPADNRAWLDLLRTLRTENVYVAFYVYPDSYEAFRAARESAVEAHFEFGLKVVHAGRKLIWGSSGSSPPPL